VLSPVSSGVTASSSNSDATCIYLLVEWMFCIFWFM
jgi:hypothetical protein